MICFWASAVGVIASIIFLSYPELDLLVAEQFFQPGAGFVLNQYPWTDIFSDVIRWAAIAIGVVLLVLLAWTLAGLAGARQLPQARTLVFLFAVLVVGPGLTVNTLLKDNWGRARPKQVEMFGGEGTFSPPLVIADQCGRNCSFVAGDPSVGFYFVAFGLAFGAIRRRMIVAGLTMGALFGLMRIGQGAHFLSDVIFSGVVTCLVAGLIYHFLIARRQPGFGGRIGLKAAFSPTRQY